MLAHMREGIGAHHSPDLFHAQRELHKATSLPLRTQVSQAGQEVEQAGKQKRQAEEKYQILHLEHASYLPLTISSNLSAMMPPIRQSRLIRIAPVVTNLFDTSHVVTNLFVTSHVVTNFFVTTWVF